MYLKKDEQLMREEVIIVSVLVTFEFVLFYKKKSGCGGMNLGFFVRNVWIDHGVPISDVRIRIRIRIRSFLGWIRIQIRIQSYKVRIRIRIQEKMGGFGFGFEISGSDHNSSIFLFFSTSQTIL